MPARDRECSCSAARARRQSGIRLVHRTRTASSRGGSLSTRRCSRRVTESRESSTPDIRAGAGFRCRETDGPPGSATARNRSRAATPRSPRRLRPHQICARSRGPQPRRRARASAGSRFSCTRSGVPTRARGSIPSLRSSDKHGNVPRGSASYLQERQMANAAATMLDTEFKRGLGLYDSTMVDIGSMIGSGIFIVSADMSRKLGSSGWLLAAWLLTGVLTVCAALAYGELAAMMPRAGGQYVYLREAFSPLWGFLYGWTLFLVIQTGTIAAVSVGFARYLGVLVPGIAEDRYLIAPIHISSGYALSLSTTQLVGILLIALLTWTNTRGLEY